METVFIAGCNGLLGQKLVQQFMNDYEVYGGDVQPESYLPPNIFHYEPLDITQRQNTVKFITKTKPAFIINAAAFTNVDGAEKEKELCWQINVMGIENLTVAARKVQAHLVQVSTDYIFDGTNGPYRETDSPNAIGFYGKSKLAAENVIMGTTINWSIVRTMVLYGTGIKVRPNFVTWLIAQLRAGKQLTIVDDQFGNPTLADDLARGIFQLVRQHKTGIFNMTGADILNRYEFSLLVAEVFDLDQTLIVPIKTRELNQPAPRPLNSGFILEKARQKLGISFLTARESLLVLKKQLEENLLRNL